MVTALWRWAFGGGSKPFPPLPVTTGLLVFTPVTITRLPIFKASMELGGRGGIREN